MTRVAVCDDSESLIEEATALLERFSDSRRLDLHIDCFTSTEELLAQDDLAEFDIVFMDIEFGGKPQGIEAVRQINEIAPNCQVVYLSNCLQYSVDVYHTDHVWFVLKSQFEERLPEVFEKLARIEETQKNFIVIAAKESGILRIPCAEIVYLERVRRLTRLVTSGESYEVREKLAELMKKLPATTFAYCHSSIIVNMPRIQGIHDCTIQLDNGDSIPISRRYAKNFRLQYFEWADAWTV